jgi:hypothetical protein
METNKTKTENQTNKQKKQKRKNRKQNEKCPTDTNFMKLPWTKKNVLTFPLILDLKVTRENFELPTTHFSKMSQRRLKCLPSL